MTTALAYSPNLAGILVLVVDDNSDSLEIFSIALRRYGAIVRTAANAREALAIALRMHPDVIVSDLAMPDEDGLWLIEQLKRGQHDGPIAMIALTAYRGRYSVLQAADVG